MPYDPAQPHLSHRWPMCGRSAVATSQPLAAQAGLEQLVLGGNAVDAALAAAITLTVVEPNNNGLGSDAFAQLWIDGALYGLNASGRAPADWTPARFAGRDRMPDSGWDSVTVPGAVSAWQALSRRFGRRPFAALFESAIRHARDGFPVGPKTAGYWHLAQRQYAGFDAWQDHFCPNGRAPAPGEIWRSDALAASLTRIAESDGEDFYRGELAGRMVEDSRRHRGALSADDLADHRADWVSPIEMRYGEHRLTEIPPNGQGIGALIAIGILDRLDHDRQAVGSPDWFHLQIEAVRIGLADLARDLADPAAMHQSTESLLDPARLDRLAAGIDVERASERRGLPPAGPDTVYLCTADADGNMVSFIQSNYLGFGSGVVVPETGIALQNRGHGFSLTAGHPNLVGPRKRPFHTIIPGFVLDAAGAPDMTFGVMGGHMQAQGHVQMLTRIQGGGQNPQTACDAPRWHLFPDGRLGLERGFDASVAAELARRGHRLVMAPPEHTFGGAQLIRRIDGGWCAASDPRKEGQALVR